MPLEVFLSSGILYLGVEGGGRENHEVAGHSASNLTVVGSPRWVVCEWAGRMGVSIVGKALKLVNWNACCFYVGSIG